MKDTSVKQMHTSWWQKLFIKSKPVKVKQSIFYTYYVGEPELSAGQTFWPVMQNVRTVTGGTLLPEWSYNRKLDFYSDKIAASKKAAEFQLEDDIATRAEENQ